ncbi:MAG: CPBP family intramembrane glutamic endopeptidase [Halanaerobiales bacterium]
MSISLFIISVIEEMFWREIALNILSTHIGILLAVIIQAFLFAVCHNLFGWKTVIAKLCMGLILGGLK